MPKTPPRDNPKNRAPRTVRSAAELLQRVSPRLGAGTAASGNAAAQTLMLSLRRNLPAELHDHLTTVLEKPGELVLFTDSAAWAARLRHSVGEMPELLAGRQLTVRVAPAGATR